MTFESVPGWFTWDKLSASIFWVNLNEIKRMLIRTAILGYALKLGGVVSINPGLQSCPSPKFDPSCIFSTFTRLPASHTGDAVRRLQRPRLPLGNSGGRAALGSGASLASDKCVRDL